MITPSLALPVQPAASGQAPGTGASNDSGDGAEVDFAALIGAGIAVKPGAPDLGDTRGVARKLHAGEDDKDATSVDPLALLDAIASGQITLDPKAAAAAAAAAAGAATAAGVAASAQSAAKPGTPTPQGKQSADSRTASQIGAIALHGARDATVAAKTTTNSAKTTPQTDAQDPKDLPRDKQAVADEGTLPVTTTTAAATPAVQPQAGPAAAVKVDLPERAPEITPTAASAAASAQALAGPAPAANRNAAAAVTQLERLMQPVGTPAWNDGLANRVVWMAKNDVQTASIQLNPPNLGPVEIKVTVVSDPGAPTSATVQFSAAHSATRDAIESSMPRLHDALRESGITLGNASVDSGNAGQARQQAESGRQSPGHGARADLGGETFADTTMQPRSTPLVRGGTGLVDTFA